MISAYYDFGYLKTELLWCFGVIISVALLAVLPLIISRFIKYDYPSTKEDRAHFRKVTSAQDPHDYDRIIKMDHK